ncbi:MAG: cysteine synthase A [Phormidesmis priestleyi Ana]|uniref:cysteine synthase n=1 Tax=Phormidesmis priestleyi Ana TaxID=1666911 RepID=A0A0P8BMF5_9CYAN|nr:MAG: cysteine synthase A [Phormidesmis priestleyi Ana]
MTESPVPHYDKRVEWQSAHLAMDIKSGFVGAVGNTPLIRLNSFSEETGCEILGKAEFLNPGGSVKDRAALFIIEQAEKEGRLKPGGTVVEGTAGNTGIGLTHICNAKGYKCVIVIPETQSQEKMDLLRTLGAEVRAIPAVPYKDDNNYVKVSGRLADELDNAIWANQFENLANRQAHYETTAAEIWAQTSGQIDGWTAATGTGGTYAGVSMFLKEKNPAIRCVVADPMGSGLYSYVKTGEIQPEGSSITEGIGNSRLTGNMQGAPIDDAIQIDDHEALRVIYQLLYKEGLFMGGSVGINVGAAVALAKEMGPGHTIVTILCDGGSRYQSKIFNRPWLESKGLWSDDFLP